MLADVVGWTAAILGMLLSVPQLIKLIRTRDTNGLSLQMWQIQTACVWAWFAHGVIYDQPNQIISCGFAASTMLAIVIAVVIQRRPNPIKVFAPILIGLIALVMIDLLIGRTAFGLIVIVPQIYALVVQFEVLRKARSVSGFSPLFSLIGVVTQVLYVWWGVLILDPAIFVSSLTNVLLHSAILAIWWRRRGPDGIDVPQVSTASLEL